MGEKLSFDKVTLFREDCKLKKKGAVPSP